MRKSTARVAQQRLVRRNLAALLATTGIVGATLAGLGVTAASAAVTNGDPASLTLRLDDPLKPILVLHNTATAACQVANTTLGTLSVREVTQDGKPITPILANPGLDEPLDQIIGDRIGTLAPDASLELAIPVIPTGPTGHALVVVNASGPGTTLASLYPIEAGKPLHLIASYALPAQPDAPPATADPATSDPATTDPSAAAACIFAEPAAISPLIAARGWLGWGLGAAIAVALLLLAGALLRRRSRRARAVATALILLASAAMAPLAAPPAAQAQIIVDDPGLRSAFDSCSATLHQRGHDPGSILPTLEGSGVRVHLIPTDGPTYEVGTSTDVFIYWNVNDHHQYRGGGGAASPCDTLYHELDHAYQDWQGGQNHYECVTTDGHGTGIGVNEVLATRLQNALRRALGLPERTHYGRNPLPAGECRASQPTDARCTDSGCAQSVREPHLTTFDGRYYDFQAVGEFVTTRDARGGFEVQSRQQPYRDSRLVAINTAVAMSVDDDRVQVHPRPGDPLTLDILINGAASTDERAVLPHGGQVTHDSGAVLVTWPDGSTAAITTVGVGLDLTVQAAPERKGHLVGLLGDFNGNPANDLRPSGQAPIEVAANAAPSFAQLYPAYADSWRVNAASSLFTYATGTTTATYTDRGRPERATTTADLTNPGAAEAICHHYGVTDPRILADCVLDVGLTGDPAFASAARGSQAFADARAGRLLAVPSTADLYLAGAEPLAQLPGGAGTLPLRLSLPAGKTQLTFTNVDGLISPAAGYRVHGPAGGTEFSRTEIPAFNGLPAVVHNGRSLFLVGVFVPLPQPAASTAVDLTTADRATATTPTLGEIFYIGDGQTPSGTPRSISIPAGATALYVGFVDASAFQGSPGYYADNSGTLFLKAQLS